MVRLRPAAHCGAIAIALALGAAAPTEADEILFRPARLDFVSRGVGIPALGDLDGDGHLDAAVSGSFEGCGVHFGRGDGTFGPPTYYPVAISAGAVRIGDFDGDEIPDLAVANYSDVSILLGLGDGTFGPETRIPMDDASYTFVAVDDLDGDGALDVAAAGRTVVAVARGRGDGTFHPADHYSPGLYPRAVAIGDLDGDEIPDLAVANQGTDDVAVLHGAGDGTFGAPVSWPAGDGPEGVAIGDVDGDGTPDLVVASLYSGVAVLRNQGSGSFPGPTFYPTDQRSTFVLIEDLDHDGALDIVTTGPDGTTWGTPGTRIFPGNGDGTFGPMRDLPEDTGPGGAAAGDVNADGHVDLTVSVSIRFSVHLGHGAVGLETADAFPIGSAPIDLAHGLLDADPVPDLVAATEDGISVLRGRGDGSFDEFAPVASGAIPQAVEVADLDGDDVADLAVIRRAPDSIASLLGRGDATFEDPVVRGAGHSPRSLAVGDFDHDDRPDLAITNSHNVGIFRGNGDGTFADPAFFATDDGSARPGEPGPVRTADLDGDGALDLAVAHNYAGWGGHWVAVAVLLGGGDGTFGPPRSFKVRGPVFTLSVDDLDGDGVPDLAVGSFDVSVLRGRGDGTFEPPELHHAGFGADFLTTGDFDGDGLADLAAATNREANVSIFRNRGTARPGEETFALRPTAYGVGVRPRAILATDLDGDGRMDLATANTRTRDVSVLLAAIPTSRGPGIPASESHPGSPRPSRFAAVSPNPFRATTVVRFSLASPEPARLEVFNILGQRVRTLVDARLLPGSHAVTWDGRDGAGRTVAPGVYLVRLQTGAVSTSHKVARVHR